MNLRDFQYAETLARTLHFGEAARQCHVSQSTLSIQIKKLEASLGTTLFERDGKTVRISHAGEQLLPYIRQTLRSAADLRLQAEQLHDPLAGTLRLGIFPTLAPYLLPHLMPALVQAFPQLRIELMEEKTELLLTQLLDGTLDAALIALPVDHARLDAIPLFAEPFLLAVPSKSPLAKRKTVDLKQLRQTPLLLLDEGHCLRDQALDYCSKIGTGESQSYRATSLETLRHMIASGAGSTLMPYLAATPGHGITYLRFSEPQPQRQIALVFRSATVKRLLFMRIAPQIRAALKPLKSLKALGNVATIRHS